VTRPPRRWRLLTLLGVAAASVALAWGAEPAHAHGFNSVVYVQVDAPAEHELRVELNLEYDLLVYSVDKEQYSTNPAAWNDDFYHQAYELAWRNPDVLPEAESDAAMAKAIEDFSAPVEKYLTGRLAISVGGRTCLAAMEPGVTVSLKDPGSGEVPFARVTLDYTCPGGGGGHPVVESSLFPDSEGFVTGTKTLVTFDLAGLEGGDEATGQLILDQSTTSGSTDQTSSKQFWEFFLTGFTHVLHGLDHLLFLVALVAGSRRLREVVLGATAFTLAHAVTVSLVALGAFTPGADVVEPTIAFSIAAVAAWHLIRLAQHKGHTDDIETTGTGHFSLDRDGWVRVGIVFAFGLVHGMGFARALNIDGRSGWDQLLSLLSFNIGIEAVQLCIILAMFPLLMLLRRRSHVVWLWTTGIIALGVTAMGLIWLVGRASGWYDISSDIG
jgi:HupE/UreJ protein